MIPAPAEEKRRGVEKEQLKSGLRVQERSQEEQEKVTRGLRPAREIIGTLHGLADKINTQSNPISATLQGLGSKLGAVTGMSNLATAYDDQANAFIGVLSRAIGGERGVLTDQDIKRVRRGLPAFTDTLERKNFKFNVMERIITAAEGGAQRQELDSLITELTEGKGGVETPGTATLPTPEEWLQRKGHKPLKQYQ